MPTPPAPDAPRPPDTPTAGAAGGVRPATAGVRVGSYLVDLGLALAAAALTWPLFGSLLVAVVVAAEVGIALSLARAATGRTPGALLTHSVAHVRGGDRAPGLRRQGVRSLVTGALHLTAVGPLVTAATARPGEDWVDRLAGTELTVVGPGRVTGRAGAPARSGSAVGRQAGPLPAHDPRRSGPVGPARGPAGPPTLAVAGPSRTTAPTPVPGSAPGPSPAQAPGPAPAQGPGPATSPASGASTAPAPGPTPPRAPGVASAPPPAPLRSRTQRGDGPVPPGAWPAGAAPTAGGPLSGRPEPGPSRPEPVHAPGPAARPPLTPSARPTAPAEPPGPALPRLWAVLDNGRRIELGAVTVLGRDPGSNEVTETVVAISDPTRSLSRTHLRIGRDETGLWLQDTFSANGTGYRTGDGHTVELVPGRRVHVAPGTVVLLGDRSLTLHSEG